MINVDLRDQIPPLGYQAEQVPILDLSNFDPARDRFPNPAGPGKGPVGVFHLRDHPDYVLRHRDLQPEDASTLTQLRALFAQGNQHYRMLEELGLYIPPHRHIEATIPRIGEDDGDVFTIAQHLSSSYENLDPSNKSHLAGCLATLGIVYEYTRDRVADPSPHAEILYDISEAKQYSVDVAAGRVALHDTDVQFWRIRDSNGSYAHAVMREMGYLHMFIGQARETASGTPFEEPLAQLHEQVNAELPEPRFDRPR